MKTGTGLAQVVSSKLYMTVFVWAFSYHDMDDEAGLSMASV